MQDGWVEHCTVCATTRAGGENRSRPEELVVQEAAVLAAEHPEIVITGIHIGSYGADYGTTLIALLLRPVREVPTVLFRRSSLDATAVDDAFAELFAGDATLLSPHLHEQLQSVSDPVLETLGRPRVSPPSLPLCL